MPDPSFLDRVETFDEDVFEEVAPWHTPLLDRLLPGLSLAASYSRLWAGIALLIALTGGSKGRRTAVAGLAAIGVTSAVTNIALKGLTRRRRPTSEVPEERRLEHPDSSSFPSGHSASAAAFSGVVGAEMSALWFPLNALAGAVGFSRVYTGVHYPGDVIVGWLVGKLVAMQVLRIMRRLDTSD
jgi:undecaprenyl-diphosphatase